MTDLLNTNGTSTPAAPPKKDNNYPYSKYIKQPDEMGASSKGTMEALNKDIKALGAYVGVLISGDSKAQKGGEPLGNKYFLDTGTNCTDSKGATQPRHIFINNVPDGLPFVSSAMGQPMKGFRGLVPGVLNDLSYVNPAALFTSLAQGSDCQLITMNTRDIDNIKGVESKYVLNEDIAKYPVWWFSDCKNPVTKEECPEEKKKGKGKGNDKGNDKGKGKGNDKGKGKGNDKGKGKDKDKGKGKGKKEGMTLRESPLLIYYALSIIGIIFIYKAIKK